MGLPAEQVVIELDAKTDKHDAALVNAGKAVQAYESAVVTSATREASRRSIAL